MKKNIKIFLIIAVIAVIAYIIYNQLFKNGGIGKMNDGEMAFRYIGGSALRTDGAGNALPCSSEEGEFYATLEVGKMENGQFVALPNGNCTDGACKILPNDEITIKGIEGDTNVPLNVGSKFNVMQLGTDNCTNTGTALYKSNGIVVDLLLQSEGGVPLYETEGEVIGKFVISNGI